MPTIEFGDIQGNILNGYKWTHAAFLPFRFPDDPAAARDMLSCALPHVTSAERWDKGKHPRTTLNVGLTYRGLERLGMSEHLLGGFPAAYREGPRNDVRARQLGDVEQSAPDCWDEPYRDDRVDLLITVYAESRNNLPIDRVTHLMGRPPLAVQEAHGLRNKREHFGYADGAGQPWIEDVDRLGEFSSQAGGGVALVDGGFRPVRLGEFVLGYENEDGEIADQPAPDLVRNGTYMVFRKLQQDVAAFRKALAAASDRSKLPEELVAAKVVGRWRDGLPLARGAGRPGAGTSPPTGLSDRQERPVPNDFRFLPDDRLGRVCPRGAHIRRANPRDSLTFGKAVRDAGRLVARHRIIRRGMPYGPEYDDAPDDSERGLVFVCYNADIKRQFELIQSQWCLDGDTFNLGDDQDFLLARRPGKMTVPVEGGEPRFVPVPGNLVTTRAAEYLFVPGRRALADLAAGKFS